MADEGKSRRVVMAALAEIRRQDIYLNLRSGAMDASGRVSIRGELDLPALADAISIALENEFRISGDNS